MRLKFFVSPLKRFVFFAVLLTVARRTERDEKRKNMKSNYHNAKLDLKTFY